MFKTLATLVRAGSHEAEDALKGQYSLTLINQKVRESESALAIAKSNLAQFILRQRNEEKAMDRLNTQITDLEQRAIAAIESSKNELAQEAAEAIADLENDRINTRKSLDELEIRISRLRQSISKSHRRLVSLKQGAASAQTIVREQKAQKRLLHAHPHSTSFKEAEELIGKVMAQDDPFAQSEVMEQIDEELDHSNIDQKLAAAGCGKPIGVNSADILEKLSKKAKK